MPKILVFQAVHHKKAGTNAQFFSPDEIEQIPGKIDTAINVVSMQEMLPSSIRRYFSFLRSRRTARFYCLNRAEKKLPDGQVTRFLDFPWQAENAIYLDGPCPFYTHFLDRTPPFVHRFAGQHLHRLVQLAPENAAIS